MEIVISFFCGIIALVLLRWFRRPIKRTAYVADYNLSSIYSASIAKRTKNSNRIYNDLIKEYPNFKTSCEIFDLLTKRNQG
jgi:hypothetical protein